MQAIYHAPNSDATANSCFSRLQPIIRRREPPLALLMTKRNIGGSARSQGLYQGRQDPEPSACQFGHRSRATPAAWRAFCHLPKRRRAALTNASEL